MAGIYCNHGVGCRNQRTLCAHDFPNISNVTTVILIANRYILLAVVSQDYQTKELKVD